MKSGARGRWWCAFGVTLLILSALVTSCDGSNDADPSAAPLRIFAAASLRDALTEAADGWTAEAGTRVEFNFAGSNVLAQQLEASPKAADIFVSAHPRWLDELAQAGLILPASRVAWLGNSLVVVAHEDAGWELERLEALAQLDFELLAMGQPDAVPAGIYAREALQAVELEDGSLWRRLEDRILPTSDAPSALAHVVARKDILAIVYLTDAAAARRVAAPVRVLHELAASSTSQIRYEAAVVSSSPRSQKAQAFVDYLQGDGADVFRQHGFQVLESSPAAP